MTGRDERHVASALAGAFLAGDWTLPGLIQRGGTTLGRRPRWLRRVVIEVLSLYHRPPRDRPRELATVVRATEAFQGAVTAARRREGPPMLVVRILAEPTEMAPGRWPVARLDTVLDLAALLGLDVGHLAWYADTAGMQRRSRAPALQLYRYRWLERAGRVPRLLEVPRPRLRRAQRTLLDQVVSRIPAHPAAHGFVPGRSAHSGASLHVGVDVVLGLDLAGFFASVAAARIYGILRTAGYPEAVAHLITGLCTTSTPIAVLGAMPNRGPTDSPTLPSGSTDPTTPAAGPADAAPPNGGPTDPAIPTEGPADRATPVGGSADDRYALRRALATPHLPQGAPTSPQLANLSAYRLDCRLTGLAAAVGATYTRYADDLTFSGGPEVARRAARIVGAVGRIVAAEGFRPNEGKTRVQRRAGRQTVTGIVVNERTNTTRADYERLRAILHNTASTGAAAQNREGHPDFRAHLLGRVAWVEALNPGRGRRLRADLDRIDWTGDGAPGWSADPRHG